MVGSTLLESEYEELYNSSVPTYISHERYAVSFKVVGNNGDEHHCVIDALLGGNYELMAINDARINPPPRARDLTHAERARENVCFRSVLLDGFPLTVVTASRPIKRGEELLIDYGRNFWHKNASLEKVAAQFQQPALANLHTQLSRALAQSVESE